MAALPRKRVDKETESGKEWERDVRQKWALLIIVPVNEMLVCLAFVSGSNRKRRKGVRSG
jgi:hypothetical protein